LPIKGRSTILSVTQPKDCHNRWQILQPIPLKQRVASSEWRLAISDWWMTFLEGRKWEGEIPAEPNLIGKS
jgi:hypothetical protein